MSKCEYCGSYIEYATATCIECGECMLCWPYECSCIIIEPYDDLEEEEEEEEEEYRYPDGIYVWNKGNWERLD